MVSKGDNILPEVQRGQIDHRRRYRPVNRIFDFLKAKYIWKYSAGVVMNPSHSVVLDGGGRNTLLAEMFHDIR
jgi:hypothetical protein